MLHGVNNSYKKHRNMSILDYPVMLFSLFLPKKEQTLHFAEIGWTITIPKGFELLTDKKAGRLQNKSLKMWEELLDKKPNYVGSTKFLAVYEIDSFFTCDFTDLSTLPEMVWQKQLNDRQNDVVKLVTALYKDYAYVTITTAADARQKGNIVFNTFEVVIATPQRELKRLRYFSTVYKDQAILITMIFDEPAVGEKMLDALRASTFEA